jgi:hypothetical protein
LVSFPKRQAYFTFPQMECQVCPGESAKSIEENHELKADSAHPPAVWGSDEGRTQGEAAGEGTAKASQPHRGFKKVKIVALILQP